MRSTLPPTVPTYCPAASLGTLSRSQHGFSSNCPFLDLVSLCHVYIPFPIYASPSPLRLFFSLYLRRITFAFSSPSSPSPFWFRPVTLCLICFFSDSSPCFPLSSVRYAANSWCLTKSMLHLVPIDLSVAPRLMTRCWSTSIALAWWSWPEGFKDYDICIRTDLVFRSYTCSSLCP